MAQRLRANTPAAKRKKRINRRLALFGGLIVIFLVGGIWWFNVLGLLNFSPFINLTQRINPFTSSIELDENDQLLLDKERIAKREVAVARQQNDLERQERQLEFRQTELETQEQELLVFEEQINEREKTLNNSQQRFENKRAVIVENIGILRAMRPEEAVRILEGYDDQLLIDTFQLEEELATQENRLSLVSLWLSQLPPERAAAVQRKSVLKYGN